MSANEAAPPARPPPAADRTYGRPRLPNWAMAVAMAVVAAGLYAAIIAKFLGTAP